MGKKSKQLDRFLEDLGGKFYYMNNPAFVYALGNNRAAQLLSLLITWARINEDGADTKKWDGWFILYENFICGELMISPRTFYRLRQTLKDFKVLDHKKLHPKAAVQYRINFKVARTLIRLGDIKRDAAIKGFKKKKYGKW